MSLPVAILAGGLATRLRPLTDEIPKALIEIDGEPFIAHQLRLLHTHDLKRVVICAWYRGDMIRDYVGHGQAFGLSVDFIFDGEHPLGTGGAIRNALPLLGEAFFVLYGDSYLPCNYQAVEDAFQKSEKTGLMTIYHNQGRWDSSNVAYEDGQILTYDKNNPSPNMQYIDYGLGVFHTRAFEIYSSSQTFDLIEVYQRLLKDGDLAAYEVSERFYEIGSVNGMYEFADFLKKERFENE